MYSSLQVLNSLLSIFVLHAELMSLFSVAGLYLHFIFVLLILCSILHPYLPPQEGVSMTHNKFPVWK